MARKKGSGKTQTDNRSSAKEDADRQPVRSADELTLPFLDVAEKCQFIFRGRISDISEEERQDAQNRGIDPDTTTVWDIVAPKERQYKEQNVLRLYFTLDLLPGMFFRLRTTYGRFSMSLNNSDLCIDLFEQALELANNVLSGKVHLNTTITENDRRFLAESVEQLKQEVLSREAKKQLPFQDIGRECTVKFVGRLSELSDSDPKKQALLEGCTDPQDAYVWHIAPPEGKDHPQFLAMSFTLFPFMIHAIGQLYGHFTFPREPEVFSLLFDLFKRAITDERFNTPTRQFLHQTRDNLLQEAEAAGIVNVHWQAAPLELTMTPLAGKVITVDSRKAKQNELPSLAWIEEPTSQIHNHLLETASLEQEEKPISDVPTFRYKRRAKVRFEETDLDFSDSLFDMWEIALPEGGFSHISGRAHTLASLFTALSHSEVHFLTTDRNFGKASRIDLIETLQELADTSEVTFPNGVTYTLTNEHRAFVRHVIGVIEQTVQLPVKINLVRLRQEFSKPGYITSLTSLHYQELREVMQSNVFKPEPNKFYFPVAPLPKSGGHAVMLPAEIRNEQEVQYLTPEERNTFAVALDELRRGFTDLDNDVFDALTHKWLFSVSDPSQPAMCKVSDIVRLRGIRPGSGNYSHARREVRQSLARLQTLWLTITTGKKNRKGAPMAIQSRALVITDRYGALMLNLSEDSGGIDVEDFRFRVGDIFAAYLFSEGRQTVLLSRKALEYDPYRHKVEKRLIRYLSVLLRIERQKEREIKVSTVLERVGLLDEGRQRRPKHIRNRLEQALDTLTEDRVLQGWHYADGESPDDLSKGWFDTWQEARILIMYPKEQVQPLARIRTPKPQPNRPTTSKQQSLADQARTVMSRRGLSQIQTAQEMGITQPSISNFLRNGTAGKKVLDAVQQWLSQQQ